MTYQCPHCPKAFDKKRYLDRHIARLHPAPGGSPPNSAAEKAGAGAGPVKFEVKAPVPVGEAAGKSYHHNDCGGALELGQTPCPTCGKEVDWGALE